MYRGRRFTRDQLLFVVQTIFRGAADQIQSSLPPVIPVKEARERREELENYVHGVVNTVGIQLPILYAQLSGDGMGAGDFPQFGEFKLLADNYLIRQLGLAKAPPDQTGTFPDTDSIAEEFTDNFLSEYILGGTDAPPPVHTPRRRRPRHSPALDVREVPVVDSESGG